MTTIRLIISWGTGEWQTVLLACGHKRKMRRAEVKAEQLYEGKAVVCAECARGNQ